MKQRGEGRKNMKKYHNFVYSQDIKSECIIINLINTTKLMIVVNLQNVLRNSNIRKCNTKYFKRNVSKNGNIYFF